MASASLPEQNPIKAREANDLLPAEYGRCTCCHAPLPKPPPRRSAGGNRPRRFCGDRCKMWTWRRGGDPLGRLDDVRRRGG